MADFDVVVVGAGPAGSTAAFYLLMDKVLLIDKKEFPRPKACAGQLANFRDFPTLFENYRRAEPRIEHHKSDASFLYWNRDFLFREHSELMAGVDRASLDTALLEEALNTQRIAFRQFKLENIESNGRELVLTDGKERITTNYVIGADGWNSKVASFLGNPPRTRFEYASCVEYDITAQHIHNDAHVFFCFNKEAGYGWVFPTPDGYNVGLGYIGSDTRRVKQTLDELVEFGINKGIIPHKHEVRRVLGAPDPVTITPRYASSQAVLCGDALGAVHQISGEGIYYAMLTGRKAADAVNHAASNDLDLRPIYKAEIKSVLKQVTIVPKIPPRGVVVNGLRAFFALTQPPFPAKVKASARSYFLNKTFRRNNLQPMTSYGRFYPQWLIDHGL